MTYSIPVPGTKKEEDILLALSTDMTSCRTYEDIQRIVSTKLQGYFGFSEVMIWLNNPDNLTYSCCSHCLSPETLNHTDFAKVTALKYSINDAVFNVLEDSKGPVIFTMDELLNRKSKPFYVDFWHQLDVKGITGFPLRVNNDCIGGVTLCSKSINIFTRDELDLAQALCSYLGIVLSNFRSGERIQNQLEEIERYKFQFTGEKQDLPEKTQTIYNYDEIIGSANGLQNVFRLISGVASSDSTVLILGETGTGKELIARAIHNSSSRRDKLMVKLNCAALPANLIESELFGHEKGSFTDAIDRRVGKFELADNSTLFLDEIGEMPLKLQAKLLRAIQEREIERVGGRTTIKTNVRLIAASNRDLGKEVHAGKFRADLFYRLNVFPITLPPLRERREDIPMLVSYFINKFSQQNGKKIKALSPKVMEQMTQYDWPGNVRELEHFIERSVLLAQGGPIGEISLLKEAKNVFQLKEENNFSSLEENERAYILLAIKTAKGKISGTGGAAEILKIPATTLHSKMKKLGLRKK